MHLNLSSKYKGLHIRTLKEMPNIILLKKKFFYEVSRNVQIPFVIG